MEGLKECQANLVVYLHPSKANCAHEAILAELSSMLFTYNETFEGIVLAYDPVICSNLAKILPGVKPYFGVRLKAKLLLFNPAPDMLLEGEVVKITPQSIQAVVLGFSSAFIAAENIREDFKHKTKHGEEVFVSRIQKKHKIKVGSIIRFSVKSFNEEILHITGSLISDHTGCARWLNKNLDQWCQADRLRVLADFVNYVRISSVIYNKLLLTSGLNCVYPSNCCHRTTKKRMRGEVEDGKEESKSLMMDRETSPLKNDVQVKKVKKKRKEHS